MVIQWNDGAHSPIVGHPGDARWYYDVPFLVDIDHTATREDLVVSTDAPWTNWQQ